MDIVVLYSYNPLPFAKKCDVWCMLQKVCLVKWLGLWLKPKPELGLHYVLELELSKKIKENDKETKDTMN
jgi:hypothetical protein